jgi:hypothetical protein
MSAAWQRFRSDRTAEGVNQADTSSNNTELRRKRNNSVAGGGSTSQRFLTAALSDY